MWNCLWGNALKRSPGIIRKSRVSYPSPGFLSSATWTSLPKMHYNGLNQTKHFMMVFGLTQAGSTALEADSKLMIHPNAVTRATLSVALYAQQMHLHEISFTTWKYSGTPLVRPPLFHSKSGLSRGVASRQV